MTPLIPVFIPALVVFAHHHEKEKGSNLTEGGKSSRSATEGISVMMPTLKKPSSFDKSRGYTNRPGTLLAINGFEYKASEESQSPGMNGFGLTIALHRTAGRGGCGRNQRLASPIVVDELEALGRTTSDL
jgi:hypothetical protein